MLGVGIAFVIVVELDHKLDAGRWRLTTMVSSYINDPS